MNLFFTEPILDIRLRLHVAVVLWVAVVWQLYTVVVAYRNASVLRHLLGALGSEYPVKMPGQWQGKISVSTVQFQQVTA